jgi:hypothetical protein
VIRHIGRFSILTIRVSKEHRFSEIYIQEVFQQFRLRFI